MTLFSEFFFEQFFDKMFISNIKTVEVRISLCKLLKNEKNWVKKDMYCQKKGKNGLNFIK